jgi:hypothetical protein
MSTTRPTWPTWRHLSVGALAGATVAVSLATPWPWDVLPVAALVACLLVRARLGRWSPYAGRGRRGALTGFRDELALAALVAAVTFQAVGALSTSVFYGPSWLPAGAALLLQVAVAALVVAAVLAPGRTRS